MGEERQRGGSDGAEGQGARYRWRRTGLGERSRDEGQR